MYSATATEQPVPPLHARFVDVGATALVTGWDIDFRQLDTGSAEVSAQIRAGRHISIADLRFNRAYHQRGMPRKGKLAFGLPIANLKDWYGQPFTAGQITNFNHAAGFDCVSRPDFGGITIDVNEQFLLRTAAEGQIRLSSETLNPESGATIGSPQLTAELHRKLRGLLQAGSAFDEAQQWEIAIELLTAAGNPNRYRSIDNASARSKAIKLALAYIEDHKHDAITVQDICQHTGIAWRTLERGFKERFGIPPKAYLRQQRLSAVRAELLKANKGTGRISNSANAWGFWHMGQFARDYKKLFGELPSATLKNATT
jgi:AraC family ethanolamine operon transcriptional activator